MIHKHEYPILEYDTQTKAVIEPWRHKTTGFPVRCVMTFFGEVLDEYVAAAHAEQIGAYLSEMRSFPVWKTRRNGADVCVTQATVASGSIAMQADYLIGQGVKNLICCGGCGVLDDIPAGAVIVPTSALRDEGASYHYLPPSREIVLDAASTAAIRRALERRGVKYAECKTWSTDAFYRETPDMVQYRKEEGCKTVEMECAALAAVARFRGVGFGQLLYSGDILTDFENYDDRGWQANATAREKLFDLALDAAAEMGR